MKNAPLILVVARHREAADTQRVLDGLARQTYAKTRLTLVHDGDDDHIFSDDKSDFCPTSKLSKHAKKIGADMVLFWPEEGTPREAALEKLVIALRLAPDHVGVADAAQGSIGLWLARLNDETKPLIDLWLTSPAGWIGECHHQEAKLFHIDEDLMEPSEELPARPYAVEQLFGKLPFASKNFEPVATEPLWSIDEAEPGDRSVLFLVTSLPMGGACKFILDIAGQLKARGCRVTVATTTYDTHNPNPWLHELLRIIPDVFVLSHVRPCDLPRLVVHLARTRNCGRVVVSHSMLGYQLLPWLRTQLPKVGFLDYTHIEYETEWPDGGYALRSINSQSLLDVAMASSHHLREWMIERGSDETRVRVCHTNIDTEKWTPSQETRAKVRFQLGVDKKTALILYPCRLAEQKRPELLCNIVAGLRRATKVPFVVVVAGNGPLMDPLKKFVEQEGLTDCIKLLGAVSLERVAELHNAADIFLLPSLIEGIALALFEAMALESVPVISDVGGQRELVTPDCGDLIVVGDVKRELLEYVSSLKHLLEHPAKRREMAAACRKRVTNHFRLEQMTTTFLAALDEAGMRHGKNPVQIPATAFCHEIATLAIDQVRLTMENSTKLQTVFLFAEKMDKQEKVIQRLQRQIETLRAAQAQRKENELVY